jgi:isopentenyl diphosphate isomerase/L-lactate dehydrogenase-like FMN-dependent dehydrogenase
MNRRQALTHLLSYIAASPLAKADRRFSELTDPVYGAANVFDLAKLAKKKLDPVAWDYIDEGSDGETALRANRDAFDNLILRPQFLLHDVKKIDLTGKLFGKPFDHPVFLCPTGGKNCVMANGEIAVAKAAGATNTMMITSGGIESVTDSGKGPKNWWQFTTAAELRTKNQMVNFVERLEDKDCSGISVTVDIYHISRRERSIRNKLVRNWCNGGGIPRDAKGDLVHKPDDIVWTSGDYPAERPFATPTWDTLRNLREAAADLPVIVKGVMTSEDTERAVKYGMSGVVVSNHGARQLDGVGGTIEALPECVKAAGGKIPVLIDGGFRRGTDILKALALGAAAVGIGRPYLWGLGAFGQRGVERVVELLRAELAADMGMAGVATLAQIDSSFVRIRK